MRQLKVLHSFSEKLIMCLFIGLFTMSCEKEELGTSSLEEANASVKAINTVKITSTGMNFDAPDEIPSGWNTFSYMNKTDEPHFFFLAKIPEGRTFDDYKENVTIPFNNYLKFLRGEDIEPADMVIADWFGPQLYSGGSGLIDAGKTAVTSINLDPGNYIIECYVKTPSGNFHSVLGMLDQITVTDEVSKTSQPKADASITIDENGLSLQDEIVRPGIQNFSVHFGVEALADVHLIRIEDPANADREVLKNWIFWGNNLGEENEGLMTPAPGGFSFLGGTQEIFDTEGGKTAYFQAVLKPGTYALISEVSLSEIDKYYEEFTIR